jgi:hypothetical protein
LTLLYFALSVFPIIEVESVATFALKISAVIAIAMWLGDYLTAPRRRVTAVVLAAAGLTASADG